MRASDHGYLGRARRCARGSMWMVFAGRTGGDALRRSCQSAERAGGHRDVATVARPRASAPDHGGQSNAGIEGSEMNETQYTLTESDLQAYVDGQLDPMRLAEVEAWLAVHRDDAE